MQTKSGTEKVSLFYYCWVIGQNVLVANPNKQDIL